MVWASQDSAYFVCGNSPHISPHQPDPLPGSGKL